MSLVGGMLAHHLGSRLSLQLIAPLFATGFMCQAAASEAILLQFGRLVCGAAGGLACGPTAVRKPSEIEMHFAKWYARTMKGAILTSMQ